MLRMAIILIDQKNDTSLKMLQERILNSIIYI
jgi:hypothetical protein